MITTGAIIAVLFKRSIDRTINRPSSILIIMSELDAESLLISTIQHRDAHMRVLQSIVADTNPHTTSTHQLLGRLQQVCSSYAQSSSSTPLRSNVPLAFGRMYPLSMITCNNRVNPSSVGANDPSVHMMVDEVFADLARKFRRSFTHQRYQYGGKFTIGEMMCIVSLHVFNISVPPSYSRANILLDMTNAWCDYNVDAMICVALKRLALLRWLDLVGLTVETAPSMPIELLMSPADCFEMAHRWNKYASGIKMTTPAASRHTMQYEKEFFLLYLPLQSPMPAPALRALVYQSQSSISLTIDTRDANESSASAAPCAAPNAKSRRGLTYREKRLQKASALSAAAAAAPIIRIIPRPVVIAELQAAKAKALELASACERAIVQSTSNVAAAVGGGRG